jgi:hypothetical protein
MRCRVLGGDPRFVTTYPLFARNNSKLIHFPARSLPVAIIGCTVLGAAVGTFDYGGKNIAGEGSMSQEEKRNNFFKPTSLRPDFISKHGEDP